MRLATPISPGHALENGEGGEVHSYSRIKSSQLTGSPMHALTAQGYARRVGERRPPRKRGLLEFCFLRLGDREWRGVSGEIQDYSILLPGSGHPTHRRTVLATRSFVGRILTCIPGIAEAAGKNITPSA